MSSVTLGMTTKGINSTSRQISGGTTLDCKLKDPVCGLHKPVLKVQGLTKTYNNYNYAIWRGRYYWVDEILFLTNDIQEVHMHLDPLATFKGAIDQTPAFVVYGDQAHCDGFVDDVRVGPEKRDNDDSRENPINMGFTGGEWTAIVTISGATSLTHNGVVTYAMGEYTFYNFLQTALSDIDSTIQSMNWLTPATAIMSYCFATSQGSAAENIRNAVLVPIPISEYTDRAEGTVTAISVGGYEISCNAYVISPKALLTKDTAINLYRNNIHKKYRFLNGNKYCSVSVVHPGGVTHINCDSLIHLDDLYVHTSISLATGDYVISITTESSKNSKVISMIAGNISFNVMFLVYDAKTQLSATMESAKDFAVNMAQLIPNPVIQSAASVTESLSIAIDEDTGKSHTTRTITSHDTPYQTQNQTLSTSGITGVFRPSAFSASGNSSSIAGSVAVLGVLGDAFIVSVNVEYFRPLVIETMSSYEDYCDNYGYPCNKFVAHLNEMSGYIQCAGAFVDNRSGAALGGATIADISTINSFLNNGIVLED